VHSFAEPVHARITGRIVVAARTHDDVGVEVREHREHVGIGRGGNEHADRPLLRLRQRRCRDCRVAARRDRQRRTLVDRAPRRTPHLLESDEVEQLDEQVTRLVRPGDVVRLVLHPHSSVRGEPECSGESVGAGERCDAETGARHRSDARIAFAHDGDAPVDVEPERRSERIPGEIATECEERVVVVVTLFAT